MKKLEWTNEPPTKQGLYWLKIDGEKAIAVSFSIDCGDYELTTFGNDMTKNLVNEYTEDGWCEVLINRCEWYGPINPPK